MKSLAVADPTTLKSRVKLNMIWSMGTTVNLPLLHGEAVLIKFALSAGHKEEIILYNVNIGSRYMSCTLDIPRKLH